MANLQTLDLSNNKISDLRNTGMEQCNNLARINLKHNLITKVNRCAPTLAQVEKREERREKREERTEKEGRGEKREDMYIKSNNLYRCVHCSLCSWRVIKWFSKKTSDQGKP